MYFGYGMVPTEEVRLSSCFFFFSSRRRHTRLTCDWSSDVCSSDLVRAWDRRSGAAFTHCVTMAAIAPWTDARSWSLTLAIAEVNASRSLLSSSDGLNVGEL